MLRRLVPLTALAAIALLPAGGAPAQDNGCTRPADPHGQVIGLDQVQLGESVGFGIDFDPYEETNWAIDQVFEVDGPGGHVTLAQGEKFTPPAAGAYTVNGRWSDTCDVTPDRTFTATPLTVQVLGPQPPHGGVELRQGAGRNNPAAALLHVTCPSTVAADEPFTVSARIAGHTVSATRAHGCHTHGFGKTFDRRTRRWELRADGEGARIFVTALVKLTGHLELRSGGQVVAAYDVRFRPRRGRERASIVRL